MTHEPDHPATSPGVVVELAGQLLDAIATKRLNGRASDARVRLAEHIRGSRPPADPVAGYGTGSPTGILGAGRSPGPDAAASWAIAPADADRLAGLAVDLYVAEVAAAEVTAAGTARLRAAARRLLALLHGWDVVVSTDDPESARVLAPEVRAARAELAAAVDAAAPVHTVADRDGPQVCRRACGHHHPDGAAGSAFTGPPCDGCAVCRDEPAPAWCCPRAFTLLRMCPPGTHGPAA